MTERFPGQHRARRLVELGDQLYALKERITRWYGNTSMELRRLEEARSSQDVTAMENALRWLQGRLEIPPERLQLAERLEALRPQVRAAFGPGSQELRDIAGALRLAHVEDMRNTFATISRKLHEAANGPDAPGFVAEGWAGPVPDTSYGSRPTRQAPVSTPRESPTPRAALVGTPERTARQAGPSGSRVRRPRTCVSCGQVLAMATDDVCYGCKPR
ncbi:MAG: hypothetical protein AB7U83_04050 [Vicinamibacterales bacterium]